MSKALQLNLKDIFFKKWELLSNDHVFLLRTFILLLDLYITNLVDFFITWDAENCTQSILEWTSFI